MNYPESKLILEEIKKANKILINCHRYPDPDSFSCALSLKLVLEQMGKKICVVCASGSDLLVETSFMKGYKDILTVDFSKFDFSKFDLLISPDTAEWQQLVNDKNIKQKPIKTIVIDHHSTNEGFGNINLIDAKMPSCAEILFLVFEDWNIPIDKDIATTILTGIIGDTGGFQFPGTSKSLKSASKLISYGADMDLIMLNLFRTKSYEFLKMVGEFLTSLKKDDIANFVYMAIPYHINEKHGKPPKIYSYVANIFSNVTEGIDFGVTMIENSENNITVSFRSRKGFDVSKIAQELGGGGHRVSAAAGIKGLKFEDALEKILVVCRKYAKKN